MDPRRAGSQAAPTPAAPPGPGGRRASRRGGYEAPKKSNAPIILGVGGGAVVILIVVLVLALGGGDKTPQGGGVPTAGGPNVPAKQLDPDNKPEDFKVLSVAERSRKCQLRFLDADTNISMHKENHAWFKARNEITWAEKSLRKILEVEPEHDWANEQLGKKDLRKIYDKIPTDPKLDEYPNPAYEALIELKDEGKNWASTEEYATAEKNLKDAIAHKEKLNSDVLYFDSYKWRQFVRFHPVYRNYKTKIEYQTPYMIFVEHTGKEKEAQQKKAQKLVERTGRILTCLYKVFVDVMGEHFELPKLEETDRPDERTLKIFMFSDRAGFDKYGKEIGQPMPPGARAYYRPGDQWITSYLGGGFEAAKVKDGSDFNTNKTFHEGVHQLMHVYTKITLQKLTGDEILWTDPRCHSRAHWFQEGVAEFFGSSKPKGESDWDLMVPYRQRLQEWKNIQNNKLAEWPLKDLLGVHNQVELRRKGMEIGGITGGHMGSLYYAQSFTFIHFLWNFENGKYKEKFLEYFKLELEGKSGIEVFAKIWWGEEKGSDWRNLDWSALDKEWRGYVQKLWDQMGIK
ncbi:MAG: hypothetical protein ACYS99_06135 [Planctomycetota bacterium]